MSLAFVPSSALPVRNAHGLERARAARTGRRPSPSWTPPACAAVRGSRANPYRIAVLPGDGAGPKIASVAIDVLSALADQCELHFDFKYADYGAPAFDKSGSLVPWETVETCRGADAVLRSYQGSERGDGRTGSAHRQLLAELGLFAQLRPVVVYPELSNSSTLRPDIVNGVDMMLVREISGGALGIDSSKLPEDPNPTDARSEMSYSKDAVERISSVALQVAERRSGRVLNVDKADVMTVSRFWRSTLHGYFDKHAKDNAGIFLEDMYVDDFVREVILRPRAFDTIVTSNLFGDIVAEVIAALAGPARIAPSVWVSRDGLGVYGPADIYNPVAYPTGIYPPARATNASTYGGLQSGTTEQTPVAPSPIAMIRSASMMLRYALEEPAAADLIQQALRKTFEDFGPAASSDASAAFINPEEFGQTVTRSLQLMRQFEQVCPPEVCGE